MIPARCLLALFATLVPALALEVRVDATGDAPRIRVDGQPVRARMFYGAPGSGPLKVGPAPGEVAFEFIAAEDEPKSATLHFRFGHQPGAIDLSALRVVDLGTGRDVLGGDGFQGLEKGMAVFSKAWNVWPTGAQNTVGMLAAQPGAGRDGKPALRVTLRAPPAGTWPDFHFYHQPHLALEKGHRYRVSFWCRSSMPRDLYVAFYRPGQHYTLLGAPDNGFAAQIKMAVAAGARFVTFPINLPWPKPGAAPDWRAVDEACQRVCDIDPRALLLPRIGMDAPAWWLDEHPDCAMVWDKLPAKAHRYAVVYAPEYRREATQNLAALIAHLEEKFGARIAGYHPCGQNTGEWFYPETWDRALSGYAPADTLTWRTWLRTRYHADAKLQAVWHDPQATLDSVVVPPPSERLAAPHGVLRDPLTERRLLDWADFRQEEMAETVCQFARAVRTASGGRKLVCFFYGYVFEFGPIQEGPAKAGHYALRRLLDCPDVDVLCSPISYFDRGLGESAPAMTAAESVALAGKLWLYEDDTHTYLATGAPPGARDHVDTREKSVAELRRNTAQCALRNFATWWMDLGATGWFNDQGLWDEMSRLDVLDTALLKQPRAFKPEIAAVIDELAVREVAAGAESLARPGIYEVRRPLARLGAPCGYYLQDDVAAGRVSAKLFIFLTPWHLDAVQREKIQQATRGALRLWCYAPESGLSGFQFRQLTNVVARATPTAAGRQFGFETDLGTKHASKPLFAVANAKPEEILATYPDGSAAVVLRCNGTGGDLFVGAPGLTSDLLRLAARIAGAHLITQRDCNVHASGPFISLHASQDGRLEIDTGRASPVRDLLTGEKLGDGPKVFWDAKFGESKILVCGE
jgi:hypothetical protein